LLGRQTHRNGPALSTVADVAVVGAGPYGLSAAAHLRAAGRDVHVFGEPMGFWKRQMPTGMLLRSQWDASHIGDPADELTLDHYQDALGRRLAVPVTLPDFVAYGEWFGQQAGIEADGRRVEELAAGNGAFRLRLERGDELQARRVVVATGLAEFPWRPPEFSALPRELVSHSADHDDLAPFAGKSVAVVGAGQSALESAALLHEAGAQVEVIARVGRITWLVPGDFVTKHRLVQKALYPPSDVGPPGLNWIVAIPPMFRTLPRNLQAKVAKRVLRPAGAGWLVPRLEDVQLSTGRRVVEARAEDGRVLLKLDDGSSRTVDHLLLATGYRVEIGKLPILSEELRGKLGGGPLVLVRGFESRVPRLHFMGAAAAYSYGPIMRFVAGTRYSGRELAAHTAGA
jgi:cation diffusion facilitator CzcD-associated flavoprotein CzcO